MDRFHDGGVCDGIFKVVRESSLHRRLRNTNHLEQQAKVPYTMYTYMYITVLFSEKAHTWLAKVTWFIPIDHFPTN